MVTFYCSPRGLVLRILRDCLHSLRDRSSRQWFPPFVGWIACKRDLNGCASSVPCCCFTAGFLVFHVVIYFWCYKCGEIIWRCSLLFLRKTKRLLMKSQLWSLSEKPICVCIQYLSKFPRFQEFCIIVASSNFK